MRESVGTPAEVVYSIIKHYNMVKCGINKSIANKLCNVFLVSQIHE